MIFKIVEIGAVDNDGCPQFIGFAAAQAVKFVLAEKTTIGWVLSVRGIVQLV